MSFAKVSRVVYKQYKQFFRFVIVGVINTGINYLVFNGLCKLVGINYTISYAIGYAAAIINSFILNKVWTFGNRENKKTTYQFIQFVIINIISLCVSTGGLVVCVKYLGLTKSIGFMIAISISLMINYICFKLWVFKNR